MPTRKRLAVPLACLLSVLACRSVAPEAFDPVGVVEAFRAARAEGQLERARALLGEDPRVWYEERVGPGQPWQLDGGRWQAWDDHFRGRTELVGDWHVEGAQVRGDMFETNDYFRLTGREGGWWRATYFLDARGRIEGFMISSAPGRESAPDRREEFEAWALATHAEEAEYLMPAGSLDPTGDRAPRMRALLNTWRLELGMEPIP